MFELKALTVVPVTRADVEAFSALPPLTGDRALKETRVQRLGERISKGLAVPFNWVTCIVDGMEYRINGQHSCEVLLGMNGNSPPGLKIVRATFVADTMEDAAILWAQYDAQISARVANEIYATRAGTIPELAALPPRCLARCATGFGHDHYGTVHGDAEGRSALLAANVTRVHWLYDIIASATETATAAMRDALERGPVMGAMIRTHRKCAHEATVFWTAVRDGTESDPRHPTRLLRDYLLAHTVANGRGAGGANRSVGKHDVFTCCIRAWNAWRTRTALKLLKGHVYGARLPAAE